ncbi:MAG: hypothetical protein DRJ66_01360 [Thermoprotei archaeon]|nr:MAG: hypothetical protein DRJ66_01360 [Thermoprotei archaeon]RLF19580.1 MAG: hypothetical protein DRZ82_05175 [Thermoprotei archaeon]
MQPFANIPPIPSSREIMNAAVNYSWKAGAKTTRKIRAIVRVRRIEARRIERAGEYVRKRLREIAYAFPVIDELHPFL